MKDLTFITGNKNKIKQVKQILGTELAHHELDLDEIQTLNLQALIEHKVRQAYDQLKRPVLVEDAGLVFTAMGNLPGPFVKWFIEDLGVSGLCDLANRLEHQGAVARVCYAIFDGHELQIFEGMMHGKIAPAARGAGGFGFDPIFINEGFAVTRGEMSEADYFATSYRTKGLTKLKEYLHGSAQI